MAELREMMTTRRNGGKRKLEEAVEEAGKTPFTRQIQRVEIPSKCILPVFTSIFDGSACAIQHVKAYTRSLLQWENNDAVMCKYFAASLAGEDLKWFEGLAVESIGSFHHLQNVFLGQYISNNMSRPGIETTFRLRRRTNETLRHLTTRWRTMFCEMGRRVDERHLILAFINALFPTDLLYTQIFRIKDTITMSELREFQEEYIALEEKQRDMDSYPVAIPDAKGRNASLLPRLTNTVASTSQGNQGRNVAKMEQKLVAKGSADQAEFENQHQNRGVDKIWEASILMKDIPEPHNAGDEPPPAQPKKLPPPPPRGNEYEADNGKNVHIIEVGAKLKNLYCNSIIHSFKNIEDFHDNILNRVYARDVEGKEILNLVKVSPLKEWKKQVITFSAEETPGGGESHECPLVVRLGINPNPKVEDDEEDEANTWVMNRIIIDTGSSVDILFYHTYKTMGGRDDELIPSTYKIYGFNGAANKPK
ncbi:uncharacterized protein LOC113324039 [Papaver somniferum]|uniref:uncharacterized protein LOC113324039 n=1 Tax=Papaver somniferum TaxID=3469 RepID=UPI000E6F862C|nr:uncharacterized protein LOC113324039 [Papaver somniferum]